MGLSVDDFLGMDTDEFDAASKAFGEHEDLLERERWERMRLLGLMTVQPWSKKKLTAEKLLPLPWDRDGSLHSSDIRDGGRDGTLKGDAQNHTGHDGARLSKAEHGVRLSKAEHMARAEEMRKLLGERY